MIFFRNKQPKFFFGLAITCTIFLLSCKKENLQEEKATVTKNEISGRDWFKSIYFADGSVTNQLIDLKEYTPEKRGLNTSELKEYRDYENEIISQILIIKPHFFETFKTEMESQDPILVENSIEEGNIVFNESLKNVYLKKGLNFEEEFNKAAKGNGKEKSSAIVIDPIDPTICYIINSTFWNAFVVGKNGLNTVSSPRGTISKQILVSNIIMIKQ